MKTGKEVVLLHVFNGSAWFDPVTFKRDESQRDVPCSFAPFK